MAFGASITRLGSDALMPEQVVDEIFDGMEQQSIILDKMTRVPNMTRLQERLMVLDTLPSAYFTQGDDALRQTTSMAWKNKYLEAAEISVIVPIPQNVMDDSAYPIWARVMPKIRQSIAQVLDGAIIVGTSAPAIWPSSMKAQAVAAGQSVSLASFSDVYQALAGVGGAFSKVEEAGYDTTGGIGSMSFKAQLRGATDGVNRPLLLGQDASAGDQPKMSVAGVPFSFAKNAAFSSTDALAVVGDTKEAIYAFRQDINFRVVQDGVISDSAGKVVINLTQQRVIGLLMWVRFSWQVPNPPTLLKPLNTSDGTGSNANNTTRSPFAILTA